MDNLVQFPQESERDDPAQSAFRTLHKTIRLPEAPPKKGVHDHTVGQTVALSTELQPRQGKAGVGRQ